MEIIKPHLTSLYTFLTLFLISIAKTSYSIQPSEFVNHFLDAKNGDKIEGLDHVRQYLIKYGYITSVSSNNHYFDDILSQAVEKYQHFHRLNPSGVLDKNTLSQMALTRCSVPDFINGNKKLVQNTSNGSYYTFETSRWYKFNLTWAIRPGTRANARRPITISLGKWALVSKFHFFPNSDAAFDASDLKMSFFSGQHGDSTPFDGPGGALAHSDYPPHGDLHFDADERWADGAVPGAYDIGTVALHEIGHLLGLGHSNDQSSIMWAYSPIGMTKGLNQDDIAGIRALYP